LFYAAKDRTLKKGASYLVFNAALPVFLVSWPVSRIFQPADYQRF
jgi:hypothetical protein